MSCEKVSFVFPTFCLISVLPEWNKIYMPKLGIEPTRVPYMNS
jgi:hypothetical protein